MKPFLRSASAFGLSLLLSVGFLLGAFGSAAVAKEAGEVVVIPVKGEVTQAGFYFLRRALKDADARKAEAVVLDMDTYGGELKAAVKIQEALSRVKVRTITYINPNSGSAGALIAVSTREIYMAPISAIGAAAPVNAGGSEISETANDKIVSYFSGYFRSAAERNGHNPDIAEAFINKKKGVTLSGTSIHEAGSLLTLSAQEAVKQVDGKPLLAVGVAESLPDLLKQAKLEGEVRSVQPTAFESIAAWITLLAPLFLLGGLLGAWLEIKMPGFGVPGIVSGICFLIFFTGHYLAGLAGWEVPALFVLGVLLVLSEVFIHPGTIIPGLLGAALMVGAILWAMVDHYPSGGWPGLDVFLLPLAKFSAAAVLAVVVMTLLANHLPNTKVYRHLVLNSTNPAGTALVGGKSEYTRLSVGAEGVAASLLRPSGKAQFSGEMHDVITRGDFVDPGVAVRVASVEGSRIVVERVTPESLGEGV